MLKNSWVNQPAMSHIAVGKQAAAAAYVEEKLNYYSWSVWN